MAAKSTNQFIDQMETFFAKAPALPPSARDILVTIAPWIALIFGILGALTGLAGVGILTAFSGFIAMGGGMHTAAFGIFGAALTIIASVLMLIAFPKLQAKSIKGWEWLFWSEVISFVASLASGGIVSAIIGALIGFYLLFQIKTYYK